MADTTPMKPGFYNMDCMEAMKAFPDGFFDLAVVDPPYGISADKFKNGAGSKGHYKDRLEQRLRVNYGNGNLKGRVLNQSNCAWDTKPPSDEYFTELFRVSKNQIIWGGNYFKLPPSRCIVVWDKMQPWENFSQVELAWTSFDKPATLFRFSNAGGAGGNKDRKIHPTQKPTELYSWLATKFAKQGDKIIDTHVGSASSLIAYHRAGLIYWGFEIDSMYYDLASERLEKEKAQQNLFAMVQEQKQESFL